jgi:hypothetical protein
VDFLHQFTSLVSPALSIAAGNQEPTVYQAFQIFGCYLIGYAGVISIYRIPNSQARGCIRQHQNRPFGQFPFLYFYLKCVPGLLHLSSPSQYGGRLSEMRCQAKPDPRAAIPARVPTASSDAE